MVIPLGRATFLYYVRAPSRHICPLYTTPPPLSTPPHRRLSLASRVSLYPGTPSSTDKSKLPFAAPLSFVILHYTSLPWVTLRIKFEMFTNL